MREAYFIKKSLFQRFLLPNQTGGQEQLIATGMIFVFHDELETLCRNGSGDGD